MDIEYQDPPPPEQLPTSQNDKAQTPVIQPEGTEGAAASSKRSPKVILYVTLVAALLIVVALSIILAKTDNAKSGTSNTPHTSSQNSKDPTSNANAINSTQNPINSAGSIGAEGQYCSDPVNAALSC